MLIHVAILLLSFAAILAGSELFTNGIEWAGLKLNLAEAAVGSVLAAVGTALPETFIPLVALLMGGNLPGAHQAVGVGAIVGAPLMLSTIALFVMGIAGLGYARRRGRIALRVSRDDARRDLSFFGPVFLIVLALGFDHLGQALRRIAAIALLAIYATYSAVILRTTRAADAIVDHGLYLETLAGGPAMRPRSSLVAVQVALGVGAILLGAREFVEQIVLFSGRLGVNPGVVSLILSPLATELPEKYNSVTWIRQGKDHLALANITGAMVFQSCIPVALGLAFTPWHLSDAERLAGAIALASSALLYLNLRDGELGTPTLMIGGAAYGIFLAGLAILGVF